MSLQTRLTDLVAAIGADIKADRTRLSTLEAGAGNALQKGILDPSAYALTLVNSTSISFSSGVAWVPNASGILTRITDIGSSYPGLPVTAAGTVRLDQYYLDTGGSVKRQAGAQNTTATLDNRSGAGNLPTGAVLIYDVLVTETGIVAANIRDRRPWARGFHNIIRRTANAAGASNYTTIATAAALIDATNTYPRFECTGNPVRMTISGNKGTGTASGYVKLTPFMDGVNAQTGETIIFSESLINTIDVPFTLEYVFTPPAGSHRLGWAFATDKGANVARLLAQAATPLFFQFEELVRSNANNGLT